MGVLIAVRSYRRRYGEVQLPVSALEVERLFQHDGSAIARQWRQTELEVLVAARYPVVDVAVGRVRLVPVLGQDVSQI